MVLGRSTFKPNQQGTKINKEESGGKRKSKLQFVLEVSCSSFHKAAESSEMCNNLADLMAHNVSTAQKFYKLKKKSMASVKALKQLRDVMIPPTMSSGKRNVFSGSELNNIRALFRT